MRHQADMIFTTTATCVLNGQVVVMGETDRQTDIVIITVCVQLWRCRAIMTLFNYSTTANYAWIFIEGLYLHMLLFVAVFSENSGVRWYIAFGWS